MQYTTQKGDTWDKIAYEQYGDEELISPLLQANPKYIEVIIFDYGTVLTIPDIEKTDSDIYLPPWRK